MKKPILEIGTAGQSPVMEIARRRSFVHANIGTVGVTDLHAAELIDFGDDPLAYFELVFTIASGKYEFTCEEDEYPLTAFVLALIAKEAVEQNRKSFRQGTLGRSRKAAEELVVSALCESFYLAGCADMLLILSAEGAIESAAFQSLIRSGQTREAELIQRVAMGAFTILNEVLRQRERKGNRGRPSAKLSRNDLAKLLDAEMIARAQSGVLPSDKADKEKVALELPHVVREFIRMGKIEHLRPLGETTQEKVDRHVRRLRRRLFEG